MKKFGELKKGESICFIENKNGEYTTRNEVINDIRENCYGASEVKIITKNHDGGIWLQKNWSRYGSVCASEEAANNFIEKTLKKEKVFATLVPGDIVYLVNEKYDTPLALTVHKVNNQHIFVKHPENIKNSEIYVDEHGLYSSKITEYGWSIRNILPKGWNDDLNYRVFIKLEDATKYITTTREKQAKKAADKYIADFSNFGKPITMKDNKGNTLHYGDKIAYVRRNGIHAHTDISFGIVMGESKTKIKILDEEEQKKGKKSPFSYHNELIGSNGLHALESQNVLFISPGESKMMTFAK